MAKLPGPTKEWVLRVEVIDLETGAIERDQVRIPKKDIKKEPNLSATSFLIEKMIGMSTEVVLKAVEEKSQAGFFDVSRGTPKSGEQIE